jgi:hypothetical protein
MPVEQQTQLVRSYLPENHLPEVRKMTAVAQVLAKGDTCTALLAKQVGTKRIEALVKLYLVRLNELLDLKRPLSEMAIDEIAATLMTGAYRNLSLTDIAFVLQQAARGVYGEMYESLNVTKVMRWFDAYFDERIATAERMSEAERSRHNSMLNRYRSSEQDEQDPGFAAFKKSYETAQLKQRATQRKATASAAKKQREK